MAGYIKILKSCDKTRALLSRLCSSDVDVNSSTVNKSREINKRISIFQSSPSKLAVPSIPSHKQHVVRGRAGPGDRARRAANAARGAHCAYPLRRAARRSAAVAERTSAARARRPRGHDPAPSNPRSFGDTDGWRRGGRRRGSGGAKNVLTHCAAPQGSRAHLMAGVLCVLVGSVLHAAVFVLSEASIRKSAPTERCVSVVATVIVCSHLIWGSQFPCSRL